MKLTANGQKKRDITVILWIKPAFHYCQYDEMFLYLWWGFFQIEMPAKINSKFCFLIQKIVILPNSLRGPIAFLVRFRFWFRLTSKISIQNFTSRDRFHWAATPLKPYKVVNICYMTYRYYSVLYFLLSLKHFFSYRKRQFLGKYSNPETVIVPSFNAFAHAQSTYMYFPIEDSRHCTCSVC